MNEYLPDIPIKYFINWLDNFSKDFNFEKYLNYSDFLKRKCGIIIVFQEKSVKRIVIDKQKYLLAKINYGI